MSGGRGDKAQDAATRGAGSGENNASIFTISTQSGERKKMQGRATVSIAERKDTGQGNVCFSWQSNKSSCT